MVYLIPSLLDAHANETLPPYIVEAVKCCSIFFVENERSARRFLKSIWKEMPIDAVEWVVADKTTITLPDTRKLFIDALQAQKNIAIISEAGCPGVADPGQQLVAVAHEYQYPVKPLVGPSSLLLALMASGLNGQQFCFNGYLPVNPAERIRQIRELENESARKQQTQLFMETPYRNNALLETLLKTCKRNTRLCIAVNLTGPGESVQTRTIEAWQHQQPNLHKQPALFLLLAAS